MSVSSAHLLAQGLSEAPDLVSSSEAYAARFAGRAGAYLLAAQTRGVMRLIREMGGKLRILDIGGGHAQTAVPLARAGHSVTVLSSSHPAEERARALCGGLGVEFITGPLSSPPVDPGSFDLVVALRMVMHMPDWRGFLTSACRSAGRGVLIDYPSWRSSNALEPLLFDLKRKAEHGTTRRYTMFWPGQIRDAFETSGFTHQRRWAECALPLVVHRAINVPAVTGVAESVARAVGFTRLFGSPVLLLAQRGGQG